MPQVEAKGSDQTAAKGVRAEGRCGDMRRISLDDGSISGAIGQFDHCYERRWPNMPGRAAGLDQKLFDVRKRHPSVGGQSSGRHRGGGQAEARRSRPGLGSPVNVRGKGGNIVG